MHANWATRAFGRQHAGLRDSYVRCSSSWLCRWVGAQRGIRSLALATVIGWGLIGVHSTALADVTTWTNGSNGGACGLFIATDTSGNVYVDDPNIGIIEKYTGTGQFLGTLGPRETEFSGLVASAQGDVYIAYESFSSTTSYQIIEYDSSGNVLQTISIPFGTGPGQVQQMLGLGVDSTGNLYVLNLGSPSGTNQVDTYSPNGTYLTAWGSSGDGNGQFDFYQDRGSITVGTDGTVYVADADNRIQGFSPTGAFLTSFGTSGSGSGQFGQLAGIAVDSSGDIYATDEAPRQNGYSLQEFNSSGYYVGDSNWGEDQFLAVAMYGNDLVYGYSCTTIFRFELSTPTVSFGPNGYSTTPSTAELGAPVTASVSASVPFGTITSYSFNFGDGSPAVSSVAASATHTYDRTGSFTITGQATSSRGGQAQSGRAITITPRPPTPPPGRVGVSINDGDYATNTPYVKLWLVWPAGEFTALISNDGGFNAAGRTKQVDLQPQIPWTLRMSAVGRLTLIAYVRFGQSDETFSDDIVLDTTRPLLQSATAVPSAKAASARRKARIFGVKLHATEAISGIWAAEFSTTRSGGTTITFTSRRKRGARTLARTVRVKMAKMPRYVRVRSVAGTWSSWHTIA